MTHDNPNKIQVQRRAKKIEPDDKLSNHVFNIPAKKFANILDNHKRCGCVEGHKNGVKVVTNYWLELIEGYVDLSPFTPFHREVLFAAISAYEQGVRVITFRTTLHSLTGGNQTRVRNDQFEAFKAAFDRLGSVRIKIDLAPLFKAYPKYAANFKGNRDRAELVGILLPLTYLETEINGQKNLTVKLLDESPLMTVAKLKKQLLTYDTAPLAISGQNNTPQVITVKNFLLRRIELIKQRGLNSSILFDTLYKECGLADADNGKKRDTRKVIADILNSFKADGVIKNFEFERRGNAYRSIKITT